MIFRSFSNAHTRLLLDLQADIQLLEDELEELDRLHSVAPDGDLRLRSWKIDKALSQEERKRGERTRLDILEALHGKMCQHGGQICNSIFKHS